MLSIESRCVIGLENILFACAKMSVKFAVLCWGNLVQADNECESQCVMMRQPCTSWEWVWKSLCYVEATLYKLTMSVKVSVLCWGNLVHADNECESHCIMLRQPCLIWEWVWKSLYRVKAVLHKLRMSVKVTVLCWGSLVQYENECESHCVM